MDDDRRHKRGRARPVSEPAPHLISQTNPNPSDCAGWRPSCAGGPHLRLRPTRCAAQPWTAAVGGPPQRRLARDEPPERSALVLTSMGASPEQLDYSEFAWRHRLRW